ncbi:MAG: hypothetical protein D3903_05805 [Candidatus Electrothrix sp. GM3_4]|nr:hypothetical protein [Candidatus Electrothrix sp. GM3_4]
MLQNEGDIELVLRKGIKRNYIISASLLSMREKANLQENRILGSLQKIIIHLACSFARFLCCINGYITLLCAH